jgi:hypothetical protein
LTDRGPLPLASVAYNPSRRDFVLAYDSAEGTRLGRLDADGRRVGATRSVVRESDGLESALGPRVALARDGGGIVVFNGDASRQENRGNRVFYKRFGPRLRLDLLDTLSTGQHDWYASGAFIRYSRAQRAFPVVWTQGLGPEPTPPDGFGPEPEESDYPRHEVFFQLLGEKD